MNGNSCQSGTEVRINANKAAGDNQSPIGETGKRPAVNGWMRGLPLTIILAIIVHDNLRILASSDGNSAGGIFSSTSMRSVFGFLFVSPKPGRFFSLVAI